MELEVAMAVLGSGAAVSFLPHNGCAITLPMDSLFSEAYEHTYVHRLLFPILIPALS